MVNDNTQLDMTKTPARFDLDTDEGVSKSRRISRFHRKDKKTFTSDKLKKTLELSMMRSVEGDINDDDPSDHTGRRLNVPLGAINQSHPNRTYQPSMNSSVSPRIENEAENQGRAQEQVPNAFENQDPEAQNENNEIADEEFNSIHLSNMNVKVSGKLELNEETLQEVFEMIDTDKDGYVSMPEI